MRAVQIFSEANGNKQDWQDAARKIFNNFNILIDLKDFIPF
jgi:hypothetical protein